MRWSELFADLESQLDRQLEGSLTQQAGDLQRAIMSEVPLTRRLVPGMAVRLWLIDGQQVLGGCEDVAESWLTVIDAGDRVLVPLSAVSAVEGLERRVSGSASVLRRLGLGHALRAVARDRAPVRVCVMGAQLSGTIDRVGRDHFDLARHPVGEARRAGQVQSVVSVRFGALTTLRSLA